MPGGVTADIVPKAMSDPVVSNHGDSPSSRRGQSLVEFALLLPMLIVLLVGTADFGRVFQAGITTEAAARDAAEAVAQEYLRNGPGAPPRPQNEPAPLPADSDYNGTTYYQALHDLAARTACREARVLANSTYTPDDPLTPGIQDTCLSPDEAANPSMPVIMTCVHDGVDPLCGDVAYGATVPPECTEFADAPTPAQADLAVGEESRYVEVRVCYRFTTLLNLQDLALPFGWGISVGDVWLQRSNVFAIGFYPPPPAPSPPPPPPPPPPEPCNAPVASFEVDAATGSSPHTVTVTNTSTQVDCPIETWNWDFGDSTLSTMKDPPPHTYTYDGIAPSAQFTVTLTATTPGGPHQASAVITVGDATPCAAPTAAFTGDPGGGTSPLDVEFTDESLEIECPITSWSWDFGDNTPLVTEPDPTHTFTVEGTEPETFTIRLTVESAGGSDFIEEDLVVDPAP